MEKIPTGAAYEFLPYAGHETIGPCPAVLIVPGWTSNVFRASGTHALLAEELNRMGYHAMLLSLRGHAGAEGDIKEVSRRDHAEDICAAVDELKKSAGVDPTRICAAGASYGGYMLASLATELDFKLLALRAPALYPNRGWDEPATKAVDQDPDLLQWRRTVRSKDESRSLQGLSNFRGKVLLVTGEQDKDMPPTVTSSYTHAVERSSEFSPRVLHSADHNLTRQEDRDYYLHLTVSWFQRNYPPPRTAAAA